MATSDLAQPAGAVSQPAGGLWGFVNRLPGAQWFKDLSIGNKLTLGFGILVFLALTGAVVSYVSSQQATTIINRTEDVRVPTTLASSRAQANLLRMLSSVRGYLALGETRYREDYAQAKQSFEADLAELNRLEPLLSADNKRRLADLESAFAQWAQLPTQLFDLRDDQLHREPAYKLLATEGTTTAGKSLIALQSMIDEQAKRTPTQQNLELLKDMADLQGSFTAMLSGLRGYVTTRNRIYRQEYQVNADLNQLTWEQLKLKQPFLTPTQQETLNTIEENRSTFLSLPDEMFTILESDRWREDLYLFTDQAVPLASDMQDLLAELTAEQQESLRVELNRGRTGLRIANQRTLVGGIFALLLGVVMALVFRENIAGPIERLTHVAERIRGGDLEAQAQAESKDETGILATTFNKMTAQLRQTLFQVRREKTRADNLLDVVIPIGVDLTAEQDFNRLLEKMLLEAKNFVHADAGVLYLLREDDTGKSLKFEIVSNNTLNMAMGGTSGQKITFEALPLYDAETGAPNHNTIATHVALTGTSLNISDMSSPDTPQFAEPKIFGEAQYDLSSCLTIPLKNNADKVLGVLQLINAEDSDTEVVTPFDENLQQMMESFSSLAVAALEAYIREEGLKQEIKQLKIEIDHAKRQREVEQIVETEVFRDLQAKARKLRRRNRDRRQDSDTDDE